MEYEIWHDEHKGKDGGDQYWHGLYFVPTSSTEIICDGLRAIRDEYGINYTQDVKFAGCLGKEKQSRIIGNKLQLFTHSLIRKEQEANTPLHNRDGRKKFEKNFTHYHELNGCWGCKYVLLKVPDNHGNFQKYPLTYAQRVETTFRFALKGGLHYLFNNKVTITGFHFDGHEHHSGHIDLRRITKGDFWEHVSFSKDVFIDDEPMKERDETGKLMIGLCDNIIGGLSAKVEQVDDPNRCLYPLQSLFQRIHDGSLNANPNGRWYRTINLSQVVVDNEQIDFKPIFHNSQQQALF